MGGRITVSALVTLLLMALMTTVWLDVDRAPVALGLDSGGPGSAHASYVPDDLEDLSEGVLCCGDPLVLGSDQVGGEQDACAITFDACGGTFEDGGDCIVVDALEGTLPRGGRLLDEVCTREGYETSGWWTEPDGGVRVLDGQGVCEVSVTLSEETVELSNAEGSCEAFDGGCLRLFARWEPVLYTQAVEVRFQQPDGSFAGGVETCSRMARAGEEFLWERDEDGVFERARVCYLVSGDTHTTLDVLRRRYHIVYDLGGDEDQVIESEAMVDEVVTLAEPKSDIEGRTFVGWALSGGSDACFAAGEDVVNLASPDQVVVLVAVWEDETLVTFDLDCPEDEIGRPLECLRLSTADEVFEVPDVPFERDLYNFVAWTVEIDGAEYVFQAGDAVSLPKGEAVVWEFVAQWEPKQVCVVVPVSVALTLETDGSFVGECSDAVLENDSDVPVEVADVSFDVVPPWELVGQGAVVGPNDLSLCLSLSSGCALDVSDTSRFRGEVIDANDFLVIDRIWGQVGTLPEGDAELGCLRFSFRPTRVPCEGDGHRTLLIDSTA